MSGEDRDRVVVEDQVVSDDLATVRHEFAIKIAADIQSLDATAQREWICAWLRDAELLRSAVRKGTRLVKERWRASREDARGEDLVKEVALQVIFALTGKSDITELSDREIEHSAQGVVGAMRAAKETGSRLVTTWGAAIGALHSHRGIINTSSAGASAATGVGKTNGALHVAAMTLAVLGFSTADIHRTLQSAGIRDLEDRAQVRRMIRPVRSS